MKALITIIGIISLSIFTMAQQYSSEIKLTFFCNMKYEISQGRFDPFRDSLFVSGEFNGWSSNDVMKLNTADSNFYETDLFYAVENNQVLNYKFAYKKNNGTIWENDPNNTYTITYDDYMNNQAFIIRTFDNMTPFYPQYWSGKIKFTVNTNNAKSSINENPFKEIKNVVITGLNIPLRTPSVGWPTYDSIKVIYLNDTGFLGDVHAGDGIWSRDINFIYSNTKIEYKYGINFRLITNEGGNENEAGKNIFHSINIPIDPIHLLIGATTKDTFGVMGEKPIYDVVLTNVSKKIDKPLSFSLEQNFPNPFNPSTTISYSISDASFVSLKIYNFLGQEVETLVNEYKTAGYYNIHWSIESNHFPSGIYFYQLKTEGYSSTKKMILLR